MSSLSFCLLVAVIYSCSYLGHADKVTAPPAPILIDLTHSSVVPPVNVPLPKDNAVPAEKSDSSVESKVTTTENVDKKTTSDSSSTPDSPTTPAPEPPSPSPSPAPPAPPTPAPAPGPVPHPDQGLWSYTDEKENVTCIVVQFAAQLNVTYPKVVENATSLAYVLVNVPANATVSDGNCNSTGTNRQWLTINWIAPGTNLTNNMTLLFEKNDTVKNYGVKSLNVSLSPELFYNASSNDSVELYHGAEWQTPLTTSYRCSTPTRLNMTSDSASTVAALTLSRLQEEAFRNIPGKVFSAARECGGGDVPDAVPIAVGCALGGLVLVVLGAYLVARRRSAARGYLSM